MLSWPNSIVAHEQELDGITPPKVAPRCSKKSVNFIGVNALSLSAVAAAGQIVETISRRNQGTDPRCYGIDGVAQQLEGGGGANRS